MRWRFSNDTPSVESPAVGETLLLEGLLATLYSIVSRRIPCIEEQTYHSATMRYLDAYRPGFVGDPEQLIQP